MIIVRDLIQSFLSCVTLTPLSLSFNICKVDVIIVPMSWDCCED